MQRMFRSMALYWVEGHILIHKLPSSYKTPPAESQILSLLKLLIGLFPTHPGLASLSAATVHFFSHSVSCEPSSSVGNRVQGVLRFSYHKELAAHVLSWLKGLGLWVSNQCIQPAATVSFYALRLRRDPWICFLTAKILSKLRAGWGLRCKDKHNNHEL